MLAVSAKQGSETENNGASTDTFSTSGGVDRPHFIGVGSHVQTSQGGDNFRSSTLRTRYSRDQLCDVFQCLQVTPPENPLLQQFDIFTEQLLKPLMLSQSSAEEQMACLLLSSGTWTPSGVPGSSGPSGRGISGSSGPMNMQNAGNERYGGTGSRGRGMAMQSRRFPHRALESDRIDNWRQRPGPPGNPPAQGSNRPGSSGDSMLWQSREAESRLMPKWMIGQNAQSPQSPDHQPPTSPTSYSDQKSASSTLESMTSIQTESNKIFAEGIAPYWTSGHASKPQQPAQSPEPVAISDAAAPIIDGESLWNTLPDQQLQTSTAHQGNNTAANDPPVMPASQVIPQEPESREIQSPVADKPSTPVQLESPSEQQAWFYVDPSGTLQGPFSGQQMEEWDNEGYFPDDLRLRPAVAGSLNATSFPTDERGFISLSKLRTSAMAVGKSPFLTCNISPRQLAPREVEGNRFSQLSELEAQQKEQSNMAWGVQSEEVVIKTEQSKEPEKAPSPEPDIRRESWGSSISSISSDADMPVQTQQPITNIGLALTSETQAEEEEVCWGDEPEVVPEPEPEPEPVRVEKTKTSQKQQNKQKPVDESKKKRNRKKAAHKSESKEAPIDPLINAEPADVRRARLAAESLRIAEENTRRLEGRDAVTATLEEKRIQREREREAERRLLTQAKQQSSGRQAPVSMGPALPATAKWGQAYAPASNRPASLLEIQRQEQLAEESERAQEEQRRSLAAAISSSTQQSQPHWGSSAPPRNSAAPWGMSTSAFPPAEVPFAKSRGQQQNHGFWEDDDDYDSGFLPKSKQQAPKLSNILGSESSAGKSSSKVGQKEKKDSKVNITPEMSALASWVVAELSSKRYSSSTSLSPDIVPAFARLLGTIDEGHGIDELMSRASPYFYRSSEARQFVNDFISARTRLQQQQSSAKSNPIKQSKPETSAQQRQKPAQPQPKGRAKKAKPIPVSASALFKLVGPPPPAPQLD